METLNGKVPIGSGGATVRGEMKKYWSQFQATAESMMLCSAANESLAEEDRAQILQVCPDLKGKAVLELGAGIGYLQCYNVHPQI